MSWLRYTARALLALCLGACDSCKDDAHLGSITEARREVARDHLGAIARWEDAEIGGRLHLGEGLRTGDASEARIEIVSGGALAVRPNTVVRLRRAADGQRTRLDVEMGEIELEGGQGDWDLDSFFGRMVIEAGSRVRIDARGDAEMLLGAMDLYRSEGGDPLHLERGQSLSDLVGPEAGSADGRSTPPPVAVGEGDELAPEPAAPGDPSTGAVLPARLDSGEEGALPVGASPGRWSVELARPVSATIHAPTVPVSVGVRVGDCEGGWLIVGRGGSRRRYQVAGGIASVSLGRGRHRWETRCSGVDRTRGSLQVVRDSGTSPLPRSAPTSDVELDGRRYTVLYQNRVPAFAVRWPGTREPAVLMVDGRPAARGPGRWALEAGRLSEGTHTLEARVGERRSAATTVMVRFDNVAPKVSIRAPANRAFASGETVAVQGVLLPDWRARIDGRAVEAEPSGRFEASYRTPSDRDGFALELRHPRRGLHYYVREAR